MIAAQHVRAAGDWSGPLADTVVLDFDDRFRRRTTLTGVGGLVVLLDLAEAVMLRGGDALVLEDGRLIEVVAAPETLAEVRAAAPGDLVRLAWHLGNRHLATQIMPKALRIRADHVVEEMLRGLGARVVRIEAPFDPEGGAYAARTGDVHGHAPHDAHRGHDHHDHHDHAHEARDDHAHDHHGHDHKAHDHEAHDHHGHDHGFDHKHG